MAIIDYKALFCVLLISSFTRQNEDKDTNPFLEAARSMMESHDSGGQGMGNMIQSFMQSGGGKQLGEMFAAQGDAADWLSRLGSILSGGGAGGGGAGGGMNAELLGQMVEMISGMATSAQDENNSNVDDNNNEQKQNQTPWRLSSIIVAPCGSARRGFEDLPPPWAVHNLPPSSPHQPCRLTMVPRWVDATSAAARRPH
ncbi:hypothetical protein J6590_065806 [Homalodisca vitripennis]|nr:hypothetical protein J6590_065806 [Homalodisca vitripennis]